MARNPLVVRVVTAAQAVVRDAAAINAGVPSGDLMAAAGRAAADAITRRYAERLAGGVAVFAGPGNNGGDAWVVARHLAGSGAAVRVSEIGESRTADAQAAREAALPHISLGTSDGKERLVVDGLLGTGAKGAPSGPIADAIGEIGELRRRGAIVVALDIPTGLNPSAATDGESVVADLTVTFGTVKRGQLLARGRCGTIVALDIGLGAFAELRDGAPGLIDQPWVSVSVPGIAEDAHKGNRRRVAIVGGARGMAGATILAARGAMRSGVGMVRLAVASPSLAAVQGGAVEATAVTWPLSDDELRASVVEYAHAVLLGPGLGTSDEARELVRQTLTQWRGPVVLDADALNLFAGDLPRLAALLGQRPAIITPHVVELARLIGGAPDDVVAQRFDIGRDVARALGAVVLLKGVPTVITAPDSDSMVSATGTAALATAGSGDVLSGVAVTLLAQIGDPLAAAACAAWVHGRAAELATVGGPVRGVVLDDVLHALTSVWHFTDGDPVPPELVEIPRVGDAA